MTWLLALKWARKNAKWIGRGLAVGALLYGLLTINGWRTDAIKYEGERDDALRQLSQEREERRLAQKAAEGFKAELRDYRDWVSSRPAPVVRMCQPVRKADPAPKGTDGAAAGTGLVHPGAGEDLQAYEPGPDKWPEIALVAEEAARVTIQLKRVLQALPACRPSE